MSRTGEHLISYKNIMIDIKFDILCICLIGISILFSLMETFDNEAMDATSIDYFPETTDRPHWRKWMWYFSQMTYQTQAGLLLYFIAKVQSRLVGAGFMSRALPSYFMMIAPPCLAVNIQYFLLLYPEKAADFDLYELGFGSLFPHLLDTLIIVLETSTIASQTSLTSSLKGPTGSLKVSSILNHLAYVVVSFIYLIINKLLRDVWSYDLFDMTTKDGWWIFFQTVMITQLIAMMIYSLYRVGKAVSA